MNVPTLKAFEEEIADLFNAGKIPYPVHLESGNEEQLINIFQDIKKNDWIFGTWRLHLKALLKGVPRGELKAAIRRGESMALSFPEHRVFGSAIVGGTISIALGVALGIKRDRGSEHVWCFLGDMGAETGIFLESRHYAEAHDLPITFVVEDNGVSVCTPTKEVYPKRLKPNVIRYKYESKWPHAGAGKRIQF